MRYDLVTVGRVNMDLFAQDVGAEFADITGFDAAVGGSPTNIAIGTSRLGLRSVAFTAVGDDVVGDFVVRYLSDEGVVTDFIARKPGKATSLALVGVQPRDRFPLAFYRDDPADIHLSVEDAAALPLSDTRAVLLSGNAFSRGSCAAAARRVAEQADHLGLVTFMDLDLRPTDWQDRSQFGEVLRPMLPLVDVVIGTEEELFAALAPDPGAVMEGAPVPEKARVWLDGSLADLVANHEVPVVVIKRGPRGVTVLCDGERLDVPGFPVQVINTVGAGDAFASGLIRSRLRDADWYHSARFGNACGAIEVTRHGCSTAFPTAPEVEGFITDWGGS